MISVKQVVFVFSSNSVLLLRSRLIADRRESTALLQLPKIKNTAVPGSPPGERTFSAAQEVTTGAHSPGPSSFQYRRLASPAFECRYCSAAVRQGTPPAARLLVETQACHAKTAETRAADCSGRTIPEPPFGCGASPAPVASAGALPSGLI